MSRRVLLVGAASGAVLAACGSGGASNGSAASVASDATSATDEAWTLVQRFPQNVQMPGPVRLPISLSTDGARLIQDGPATLTAQITDINAKPVGDPITAVRRDVEPGAYYDFRTSIADAGVYYLVIEGGPAEGAAFQIMEPGTVAVAGPGDPLPPFDTPTIDNRRGVDPICTLQPEPCPFHEVTLTEALDSGKQIVYLIGTPAFCQTGSCAPGLESMIAASELFSDTHVFVHAEVYTDNTATTTAPAVDAAGLTYEPVVFVTDRAGTVADRLDAVWNEAELVEVLNASLG